MIGVAPVDICCHDDPILIHHICRRPSVEWIFDKSQLLWRRLQVNTDILAKAGGPGFTAAILANSIKANTDVSNDQLVPGEHQDAPIMHETESATLNK